VKVLLVFKMCGFPSNVSRNNLFNFLASCNRIECIFEMGTSWIHSLSFLDRVTMNMMVFRGEVWLNMGSKLRVGAGILHISKVLCLLVVKDYVVKSVSTQSCMSFCT
jgi:hypothetical protein